VDLFDLVIKNNCLLIQLTVDINKDSDSGRIEIQDGFGTTGIPDEALNKKKISQKAVFKDNLKDNNKNKKCNRRKS
jgi:hypothetical protein